MDIHPDKLSPEMLDKIADHLIQKALAGQPKEVVDEARRRIEAGEKVTIEQLEQAGGVKPAEPRDHRPTSPSS